MHVFLNEDHLQPRLPLFSTFISVLSLLSHSKHVFVTTSKSWSKLRALPGRRLQNRNIVVAACRAVFAEGSVGECCRSVQSTVQMHFTLWDEKWQLCICYFSGNSRLVLLQFGIIPRIETCIFVHAPHHLFKAAGSHSHLANLQHKTFSASLNCPRIP